MTPLFRQRSSPDRMFERLYRHNAPGVYRYALALLRNPADAEDVTQTTFMNAYRAWERGERPRSPQSWLIAIAHNVCRERSRRSSRRVQEVELARDVASPHAADADLPSLAEIRQALGCLSFNQRAALTLRELEGRSYAEIGEILGLSLSAVETLIFRARAALREQLEGALSCDEAGRAISRQLDGRLPRGERGALRAHLRACGECAHEARRARARRGALRVLSGVPLPPSLGSLFGGGATAGGAGMGAKAATVLAAGALAGGVASDVPVARAPDAPRAAAAGLAATSPSLRSKQRPAVDSAARAAPARPAKLGDRGAGQARSTRSRSPRADRFRAGLEQQREPAVRPARLPDPVRGSLPGRRKEKHPDVQPQKRVLRLAGLAHRQARAEAKGKDRRALDRHGDQEAQQARDRQRDRDHGDRGLAAEEAPGDGRGRQRGRGVS